MNLAFIPSPSHGVVHLGPVPLRGYAFCIIVGVFVAVWLGEKRWTARGGTSGTVADIAVWAVPFGLVGGRLYHVITDYELYFTDGKDWVDAFKIWQGGLGIWGAIAFGALGAWIGCRRRGITLPSYADAIAPGIAFAQAIGRWGNWFNQELYGKPTDLPWALKISAGDDRIAGTYHPTFLYESLWCVGVALLVIWADRRFRLGHGRAFALYVAAYCVGRAWIEYMRVDDAHHILGLRLNDWTAFLVFAGAVLSFLISARRHPGREKTLEPLEPLAAGGPAGTEAQAPDTATPDTATPAADAPDTPAPDEAGPAATAAAGPGAKAEATEAEAEAAGAEQAAGGAEPAGEQEPAPDVAGTAEAAETVAAPDTAGTAQATGAGEPETAAAQAAEAHQQPAANPHT